MLRKPYVPGPTIERERVLNIIRANIILHKENAQHSFDNGDLQNSHIENAIIRDNELLLRLLGAA